MNHTGISRDGIPVDDISRAMQAGVDNNVFPGAVLLFSMHKKILFHEAFGLADIDEKNPVCTDTFFDLASLTKPLAAAMALVQLMERGKLSFDQTLSQLWAGGLMGNKRLPPDKADITIDMLMRHTSGLPAHRDYFRAISVNALDRQEQLRHMVLSEPLEYRPGVRQVYSDLGYILLAWIIESACGRPLNEFVRDNVYRPLGITDLFFNHILPECRSFSDSCSRFASTENCPWRRKVLKGEVHDDNAWISGGIEGHAGLFGSAAGVHSLCLELLAALNSKTGTVLDPDILSRCVRREGTFSMVAGFDTPAPVASSCGRFFSRRTIGHLGYTGTSFWIDPDSMVIVVLLTNRVHPSRENTRIKKFRPLIHDLIMASLVSGNKS